MCTRFNYGDLNKALICYCLHFFRDLGKIWQKWTPIPGPRKPFQPLISVCLFVPPSLCFDSWVLLAAVLQSFWPIWKTVLFPLSTSNPVTHSAFIELWVWRGGVLMSGHPWGSSGWHIWNPLLSTSSLAASLLPPRSIQSPSSWHGSIGPLGSVTQVFLQHFDSVSHGEQTSPYNRDLKWGWFCLSGDIWKFPGTFITKFSQLWGLCCWHLVGAKCPMMHRTAPQTRNSLAPNVNSAKVGKHHQKAGLPCPDPWNSDELFFFLHIGNIIFLLRPVPSWDFSDAFSPHPRLQWHSGPLLPSTPTTWSLKFYHFSSVIFSLQASRLHSHPLIHFKASALSETLLTDS